MVCAEGEGRCGIYRETSDRRGPDKYKIVTIPYEKMFCKWYSDEKQGVFGDEDGVAIAHDEPVDVLKDQTEPFKS